MNDPLVTFLIFLVLLITMMILGSRMPKVPRKVTRLDLTEALNDAARQVSEAMSRMAIPLEDAGRQFDQLAIAMRRFAVAWQDTVDRYPYKES